MNNNLCWSKVDFFLDENIPPKAANKFKQLGYTCESVQGLEKKGINDDEVLKLAIEYRACLCTTNGKDFIVKIPPKFNGNNHFGLIWIRGPGTWSRKNSDDIVQFIIDQIKNLLPATQQIYEVNKHNIKYQWIKIHP